MKNSAKPPVLNNNDSAENLFNQGQGVKIPLIWLGVILFPVIIAMIGTAIYSGGDGSENTETPPAPAPITADERADDGYDQSTHGRRGGVPLSGEALLTNCQFKAVIGREVDQTMIDYFKSLNRPVVFMGETGQIPPPKNNKRINIYVDPSTRIIRRVVCG